MRAAAKRYGVSPPTVQTWRDRETTADAATGPKEPRSTVLTPEEEATRREEGRLRYWPGIFPSRTRLKPEPIKASHGQTTFAVTWVCQLFAGRTNRG